MRTKLKALALVGACGLAVGTAGTARADVIYTWNGSPGFGYPGGRPVLLPQVKLDITDAAVQSGGFQLKSGTPSFQPPGGALVLPTYSGDAAGLVSFTATGLGVATQTHLGGYNAFDLAFAFDAAGDITSDAVTWFGPTEAGQISGDQASSTGTLSSDFPGCGSGGAGGLCGTISGAWTHTAYTSSPVPEPASLALLGAGMLGLVLARRRAA